MSNPLILMLSGSINDRPLMEEAEALLKEWEVPYEYVVASAHRTPNKVRQLISTAQEQGVQVIIAAAGYAAHLAGVCAAYTPLPIIAVPLAPSQNTLGGLDALLAMVQMPSGVPVATVGINQSKNAALLAVQILALGDQRLLEKLTTYRKAWGDYEACIAV